MRFNSIFAGLACFLFLAASCGHKTETSDAPQKFVLSDTMLKTTRFADVSNQSVTGELRLFGKVAADNSHQAQVFPVVGGNVVKVAVELGDRVSKGQVLAVIRSGEVANYEQQREEARSSVAIAEKNLQVARDLNAGKLNSERDLIQAQTELQTARAALQRSNENFSIYNLGAGATYNVVAPLGGFIIDKNVTENMQLRSDVAEPLFSIAQIDEVWILANVNESDISRISLGMPAEVRTIAYPDRVFRGKVDKIFNVLDDNTRAMKVRISIPNSDLALKPEMSATVSLQLQEARSMLAIPSSAVIFDKSKNWVMVYHGRDSIETRQVEVYRQAGEVSYISHGLQNGEKVITKNQLLIYDALND